jgi:hypothetical protein
MCWDGSNSKNCCSDCEKQRIAGPCGLFLSNEPAEKVLTWFQNYGEQDYPRSGFESTQDVTLEAGPLPQFSHAIEPHLRQLGMPVELKQGVVTVRHTYSVCKKGDTLNPEQCKILVRRNAVSIPLRFSRLHSITPQKHELTNHLLCAL